MAKLPEGFSVVSEPIPEGFEVESPSNQGGRFVGEPFTRNPEQPDAGINPIAGNAEQLLSGASLGLSDEIQGGIGALWAAAMGMDEVSDKTISQMTVDIRNKMREDRAQFIEQEGAIAYAPEVIGGLAAGATGLSQATSLAGAGAIGVVEGAIAGAGSADADEFLSKETAITSAGGAAVGGALGLAAPILMGLAGKGADGLMDGAKDLFTTKSKIKQDIVAQMESGEGLDTELGKYLVKGSTVVKDKNFPLAVKQGFDPGTLAVLRGATPTDRLKSLRMLDILKKGKKNKRYRALHRPGDVVGDSLLERVNHIRRVNKTAGQQIDAVAKGLKGQTLDASEAFGSFAQSLDDLGVSITRSADGKAKIDFSESILSPGDRGPMREVLRQIIRIKDKGGSDAFDAHQLKRIIDNNVTFGKSKTGLGGDAERVLKDLRHGIDSALDSNFPDYNDANVAYSETISALNGLKKAAGPSLDLSGDYADKALGRTLRRLLGNTANRENLFSAVVDVTETAKKHGGSFDDDVVTQLIFADELEDVFGPVTDTAFKSEIVRGIRNAGQSDRTVVGAALDIAEGAENIAFTKNEAEAFKIIEEFLKR